MATPTPPPEGTSTAEAWTRTDTRRFVPDELFTEAPASPGDLLPGLGAFATAFVGSVAVGAPQGLSVAIFGVAAMFVLNVAIRAGSPAQQRSGSRETPPESWQRSERLIREAMRAPRYDGTADPRGERVRVRGRVRARTLIDGPDEGWCVAWEEHTCDDSERGASTIEAAGGVFDVVSPEGVTVRVDARHVSARDLREPEPHSHPIGSRYCAVVPDGAWVEVEGPLRVESRPSDGYRGGLEARMEGSELAPVNLAWIKEDPPQMTGVRALDGDARADELERDEATVTSEKGRASTR